MPTIPESPRLRRKLVAPENFMVLDVQQALGAPLSVHLNSALIRGRQPMVVDMGSARNRERYLEDLFFLVEPEDVRWIFLSHDDADHASNLAALMERSPNARLICGWALVEQFSNAYESRLARCVWLNDGESIQIDDRTIVAARPPVYDSPTTRGLLDTRTGVYWAADAFACPVPGGVGVTPLDDADDLDPDDWLDGMLTSGLHAVAPWLGLVDTRLYLALIRGVRAHGMSTVIFGHSPVIRGERVGQAFDILGRMAGAAGPACADQAGVDLLAQTMEDG